MRKRIAVWIYGGIGTGHFSQGYPMLEKILVELSSSFEIVIYSKYLTNKGYSSSNFTIRTAPSSVRWSPFRWFLMIIYFLRDHRQTRFHLLFAFWGYPSGFFVTCLSKVFKIPSAVYVLGSDVSGIASINFGILHKPILRKIALWTYKNTSLLLAVSEFQKQQLANYGITRTIVVPWGIEKRQYKFTVKKRNSVLRIIHVGHLTPIKDQSTLLRAFALIAKGNPAELRIYGEDFMNGTLQKLCNELDITTKVHFLGIIPYHQMPEHYAWADMMLHTSLSEGQSMALAEAAACGVLLAGTRVGLLYDLGEDCGVIADVGDYKTLAAKVLSVLEDERLWNRKVDNARRWAETHDLSWTINELEQLLNSLIKSDLRQ